MPQEPEMPEVPRLPPTYTEQRGCHNCAHVFEMSDYDSGIDYFCTKGAPPRPKCGSVAMCERHSVTNEVDGKFVCDEAASHKNQTAWYGWSKGRCVDPWGICDNWTEPSP